MPSEPLNLPALPTIPTWVGGTALEQLPFSWQLPEGVEYAPASWAGDLDDYDADR